MSHFVRSDKALADFPHTVHFTLIEYKNIVINDELCDIHYNVVFIVYVIFDAGFCEIVHNFILVE